MRPPGADFCAGSFDQCDLVPEVRMFRGLQPFEDDHLGGDDFRPVARHTTDRRVTVTPISRPVVKSAEHFFWQRELPIYFSCRLQLPCLNRARFFG